MKPSPAHRPIGRLAHKPSETSLRHALYGQKSAVHDVEMFVQELSKTLTARPSAWLSPARMPTPSSPNVNISPAGPLGAVG
jgi:hypothetical protein